MRRSIFACAIALATCKPSGESTKTAEAPVPSASESASIWDPTSDAATESTSPFAKPQVAPPAFLELSAGGVGFDDLVFAPAMRTILTPAGGTGELDVINEDTFTITKIGGFSVKSYAGGHDDSITSAAFDARSTTDPPRRYRHLFVVDRSAGEVIVVDASTKSIVSRAKLGAGPDYVRWIAATHEVWVTEPSAERIETFHLEDDATLKQTGTLDVKGGPESLVVDDALGIAFSNLWRGSTVDIDVKKRAVLSTWPNGCKGSRGMAEDPRTGFVLVGCAEGKASVLDARGKIVGTGPAGAGVDIVAFDPRLSHLYVPAAKSATLTVFLVGASGALEKIGEENIPQGSHCATVDDRDDIFLCDPAHGRLVVMHDHWSPKDR